MPNEAESEVYVGIDVCKAWLDVYLHPIGQITRVANSQAGLEALVRTLACHDVALVTIEATGKLHRLAHRALHAGGFRVAVVNPYRARRFAEMLGQLAKTDAIDARVLALFERRGQRHIKGGRSRVRAALYFAALTAVRKDPGFRSFADRLKAAGKPAKVILTAVMRKLIVLANTLITENRTWNPIPPQKA